LSENAKPSLTPTIANAGFDGSACEHCGHETSNPPVIGCDGGTVVVVAGDEVVVVEVVVVEVVVVEVDVVVVELVVEVVVLDGGFLRA
jgi:hypothetical protein